MFHSRFLLLAGKHPLNHDVKLDVYFGTRKGKVPSLFEPQLRLQSRSRVVSNVK